MEPQKFAQQLLLDGSTQEERALCSAIGQRRLALVDGERKFRCSQSGAARIVR